MTVEWVPEKHVILTAEELAQAIVDVRIINFPSLIGDRGVMNEKRRGADTEVRDRDLEYARVLLARMMKNRKDSDNG